MRSEGDLFARVWSLEALLDAWRLARHGKRRRVDVCDFEREWIDRLLSVGDALRLGTWRPGPYKSFVFEEHGKRRVISAKPMRR